MVAALLLATLFLAVPGLCDDAAVPSASDQPTRQYPPGDVRACPTQSALLPGQPLYRMEVLPGIGFDNLRNVDMGQVSNYDFSLCRTSNDGKYLLPDSIFLIPTQQSHVEVFAEYFDNWDDYTSTYASSVNVDAGFFSVVNAKFSSEFQSVKTHQVNDKSKTTRVQVRHKLYTVKLQPDSPLHPTFRARIFDIAANLQNNNTQYAHYLAELLVREYGTHYITSMDAGAVVSQVDHIYTTYAESSYARKSVITASAGANFFGKVSVNAGFSFSTSDNDTSGFLHNRSYTEVFTYGGPPFRANFTLEEWEDGVDNAMVAIDRSGDPLHYIINPTTLPELPEQTVREVANTVFTAINRYYKVNTRPGCTQMDKANFDFQANLDDGVCEPANTNLSFGGVYQTCTVSLTQHTEDLCNSGPDPAAQKNPLTGGYSCPLGYSSVLLNSGTVSHVTHKPVCNNVCQHCGWWSRCCHCETVLAPFLSMASYEAYWCVAEGEHIAQNSGYLFGGFYTSTASNPVTGSMSCPRYFVPLHFGENVKVCVSNDFELGYAFSIPFAGFDSCHVGNPLAASPDMRTGPPAHWPHACPVGFAQHLVTVDEGCEINFCVKSDIFRSKTLLPAKLPPYRKRPHFKNNVTDTLVVFGIYGNIYVKNDEGNWELVSKTSGSASGLELLETLDPPEGIVTPALPTTTEPTTEPRNHDSPSNTGGTNGASLSNGVVAAISVVATLALGTVIVVGVFCGCSVVKKRKKTGSSQYMNLEINSGGGGGPATSAEQSNI